MKNSTINARIDVVTAALATLMEVLPAEQAAAVRVGLLARVGEQDELQRDELADAATVGAVAEFLAALRR